MRFPLGMILPYLHYLSVGVGLFIASRLRTPRDHERAALLDSLARGFTDTMMARYPGKGWAVLLDDIVRALELSRSAPTVNSGAIRRAVVSALANRGIFPKAQ